MGYPGVHILCERVVPSLLEDVFIHKGVAVEAFKGGTDTHEVVSTCLKSVFYPLVDDIEVAGQHRVAAKVAEVAPDVRHTVIAVGAFPNRLTLAVVVQQQATVLVEGGDISLDAVVNLPILALVPEEPGHLQPSGFGIGSL